MKREKINELLGHINFLEDPKHQEKIRELLIILIDETRESVEIIEKFLNKDKET